ncbi:hypothetical protein IAD21_00619 [Abditibacteriota bacterium]|nr:hypothetical protein IAD21_00619 [Abditibacteriota bacterium]
MTTPCPNCGAIIAFTPIDGECIVCEACALDCEIHVDRAYNEATGHEHVVVFLEPLAEFHNSPLER